MTPSALPLEAEIVVVGAGYAGVLCANRLARKTQRPVLLVSAQDTMLHRVRLHETAARGVPSEQPLAPLLHPRVELLVAHASGLTPRTRRLEVEAADGPRSLAYRTLVLALGSHQSVPFEVTNRHALGLASHARALVFFEALRAAPSGAQINVVGGGLTALELASEIAEAHPQLRVRMLCGQLAAHLPKGPRAALDKVLAQLSVEVVEDVAVHRVDEHAVYDGEGRSWPAALSVVAAGFRATVPAWLSALPTSPDGRVAVDQALRVVGFDDLYAVGDLAAPPASCIGSGQRSTRMGCVNAMPLAAHAADVIARGEAFPFHFNYPGQNISLGRKHAITLFTDRDDQPTGRFTDGRTAALIKDLVCRLVITSLKLEARGWFGYAWLGMHSRTHAPELRLAP